MNKSIVIAALAQLSASADELRELDAALGDGDLGITVSAGALAVQGVLDGSDSSTPLGALLVECGRAFGNANPSTFAALTQGGLLASAKVLGKNAPDDPLSVFGIILNSSSTSIAERGKSAKGDKTVLDPLLAVVDALPNCERLDKNTLTDLVSIARRTTEALAAQQSKKGRAAWIGERSAGQIDPGSVAFVRFLEALRDNTPE